MANSLRILLLQVNCLSLKNSSFVKINFIPAFSQENVYICLVDTNVLTLHI